MQVFILEKKKEKTMLLYFLINELSLVLQSGSLVGWKVDARGMLQTIFHHELKDPLSHISFRRTQRLPGFDIR